ncbi:hypothetical protein BDK51DRAFT_29791 [Blyttiomyces helicus]|uniref:Uncharacterized protein n=1 Tax=Blyttiomyces helicus TaxID=388810 RepID=A0A4P9WNW4_9FUNG|nr:hypothetical protein BDK51DRAFT_29791 [Blyttiomyces helicus]|eukprot:RKO94182.1 hypothetical protein BDK51DRAFT_29791 [Blyttiomyces helicus]
MYTIKAACLAWDLQYLKAYMLVLATFYHVVMAMSDIPLIIKLSRPAAIEIGGGLSTLNKAYPRTLKSFGDIDQHLAHNALPRYLGSVLLATFSSPMHVRLPQDYRYPTGNNRLCVENASGTRDGQRARHDLCIILGSYLDTNSLP